MSQSDYIYHKKVRNILSNPNVNDLDTVLTNKNYIQYKQYTIETKGAHQYNKQSNYNKLNTPNKKSLRNMDITIVDCTKCDYIDETNSKPSYTCKLCNHIRRDRPQKQSFSRGSTVISRNTFNHHFNLQKKAMLSRKSLKINGVTVQPLDPVKDFCKCDRYFYNKNMYTTRDSKEEYFQQL